MKPLPYLTGNFLAVGFNATKASNLIIILRLAREYVTFEQLPYDLTTVFLAIRFDLSNVLVVLQFDIQVWLLRSSILGPFIWETTCISFSFATRTAKAKRIHMNITGFVHSIYYKTSVCPELQSMVLKAAELMIFILQHVVFKNSSHKRCQQQ